MSENKYRLDKTDLIALLSSYMQILPPRWESFQNYVNIYVTLILGLFSVVIVGVKDFGTFPTNFLSSFVCILILVLCFAAKATIKRQNSHIKELIVVIGKLEYQLGLYDTSQERDDLTEKKPWSDDTSFLPPQWIEPRLEKNNSKAFVKEFQSSKASIFHNVFTAFQICAISMIVFILLLTVIPANSN